MREEKAAKQRDVEGSGTTNFVNQTGVLALFRCHGLDDDLARQANRPTATTEVSFALSAWLFMVSMDSFSSKHGDRHGPCLLARGI